MAFLVHMRKSDRNDAPLRTTHDSAAEIEQSAREQNSRGRTAPVHRHLPREQEDVAIVQVVQVYQYALGTSDQ